MRSRAPRLASREVLIGAEARRALRRGAEIVAKAVGVTLGPAGRDVVISQFPRRPLITRDGVSVARALDLPDEFENMGAQLMVEAATGASSAGGDGTTTAIVLAHAMLAAGERALAVGADAMMLRRGLERAVIEVVRRLTAMARPISSQQELAHIATTAANDARLGELIAEALWSSRPDGAVDLEDGRGLAVELRVVNGILWDQGYESAAFVNTPHAEAVLERPRILITDIRLRDPYALGPLFAMLDREGVRSIFVTCHDIAAPVLGLFLSRAKHSGWQPAVVRAPAFGRRRQEICQDLAIATGGFFVADDLRLDWADVRPEMLGRAERVVVRQEEFLVIGPGGDPAAIESRAAALQVDAERVRDALDAERVRARARKLRGRAAVLQLGAPTELERDEIRPRAANALASARAALVAGSVPGGGVALLRATAALDALGGPADEAAGVAVVRQALDAPLRQIATNVGLNGALVVEELRTATEPDLGLNSTRRRYENLREAGVLDALVTVRSALVHAGSAAAALLTTAAAVRYTPEPAPPPRDEAVSHPMPRDVTRIVMGQAGRRALMRGADTLANAVRTTLGPRGRAVALERRTRAYSRRPVITTDGVTVARTIELPDQFENIGARLIAEAAVWTNDTAGDGTTTATILAQAILHAAARRIDAGASPMLLRREIEVAAAAVARALDGLAHAVRGPEEIRWVAQISAGDTAIAEAVASAFLRVGADGVVDVRDGRGLHVATAFRSGARLEAGCVSRLFATDVALGTVVFAQPHLLVTDQPVSTADDLAPLCSALAAAGGRHLVIVAPEFGGSALGFLLANTRHGVLRACPVRAPFAGTRRRDLLDDLSVATGATFLAEAAGTPVARATAATLGRAERVVSTLTTTTIIGGAGQPDTLEERRRQLRSQLRGARDADLRRRFERRLGNLAQRVAVLEVGAATDLEREARRHRVDDAVQATRAALAEGVVAGGATAYLHARRVLLDPDRVPQRDGAAVLHHALGEPIRILLENASVAPAAILPAVEARPYGQGFDVVREQVVDLFQAGIIDPLLVVRAALRHAVSVACAVLTTDAVIATTPPPRPTQVDIDPEDYAAMLSDDPEPEPAPIAW